MPDSPGRSGSREDLSLPPPMISAVLASFFPSKTQKDLKRFASIISVIRRAEAGLKEATLEELQARTLQWKTELAAQSDPREIQRRLDRLLPEAFAAVKQASRLLMGKTIMVCGRPEVWNMIPYDTQLMAGIAMHQGKVAEMATGEGKSLAAALPLYLNALAGRGVHLVTVNDYLAQRDSESIGFLLGSLGLTVGCVLHDQPPHHRRAQYACDVTYGTSAEMGFDYLRDNGIALTPGERVQRGHWCAVVDEVDSVLIDEARTPLIITGPSETTANHYTEFKPLVAALLKRQGEVLNRLAREAGELAGSAEAVRLGELLLLLKLGNPRHRVLLRLLESPECLAALDKMEVSYKAGTRKLQFPQFKEQLFYTVDHPKRQVDLTEAGRQLIRPDDQSGTRLTDLSYSLADARHRPEGVTHADHLAQLMQQVESENLRMHNTLQLLRANAAYERNVDYVIEDGGVVIVDENTGRKMPGRRWSDGLHQAVEAKEGLRIQDENHTLATITLQNYFRLYRRLAGMTGTAETEAGEFHDIYGMDVAVIPPHKPLRRLDRNSLVFPTRRAKFAAAVETIKTRQAAGQPVLVGTASVEASETLARLLRRERVPHQILNAVNHAREAELIEQAGQPGVVTVSTNMAGRGTDIRLGPGVDALGGLLVLGTERHESRRIDRQLRGRCGRQGDPGESLFLLSLEDTLLQQTDSTKRIAGLMGQGTGRSNHAQIAAALDAAQRKQEQSHFSQRKHTLDMDDVLNRQRKIIYGLRNEAMEPDSIPPLLAELLADGMADHLQKALGRESDEAAARALLDWGDAVFHEAKPWPGPPAASLEPKAMVERLTRQAQAQVRRIGEFRGSDDSLMWLSRPLIAVLDNHWREHLRAIDSLRDGIHLQYVAQKDPLLEYRSQGFQLFEEMLCNIRRDLLQTVILMGATLPAAGDLAEAT